MFHQNSLQLQVKWLHQACFMVWKKNIRKSKKMYQICQIYDINKSMLIFQRRRRRCEMPTGQAEPNTTLKESVDCHLKFINCVTCMTCVCPLIVRLKQHFNHLSLRASLVVWRRINYNFYHLARQPHWLPYEKYVCVCLLLEVELNK